MNDTLRRALSDARLGEVEVATSLGVDPKTVSRWIAGRMPLRKHRWQLADLLGQHERELWPELVGGGSDGGPTVPEIIAAYSCRGAIPREVWRRLFASAQRDIDVLVYAGLFLAEDMELLRLLAEKARSGVSVRLLFGDPDGRCIAMRGAEEGIGDAIAAKIRNVMVLWSPVLSVEGVKIRLHDTVLYNSIYRADEEMLVNTHVYGEAAAHAPVMHLRQREPGGLVSTYLGSFERIWATAKPPT